MEPSIHITFLVNYWFRILYDSKIRKTHIKPINSLLEIRAVVVSISYVLNLCLLFWSTQT